MNPIFMSALAAFFRKAKCPNCQREQLINKGNMKKSIKCKFCGNIIPPPDIIPKR